MVIRLPEKAEDVDGKKWNELGTSFFTVRYIIFLDGFIGQKEGDLFRNQKKWFFILPLGEDKNAKFLFKSQGSKLI